ncbi:MAG: hypothetical protein PVI35_00185 [Acidimicrobiia bacterium]
MRRFRAIPAGLVDSGLSSLATFIVGLYAATVWRDDAATLGVYALFLAAFQMAASIPTQAHFVPAEKATLLLEGRPRLLLMRRIVVLGLPATLLAAALSPLAAVVGLLRGLPLSDQVPFIVTTAAATALFPIQHHTRRLLHLGTVSWAAASVSALQLIGAVGGLGLLRMLDAPQRWTPIGALAIANGLSLLGGLTLATWHGRPHRAAAGDALHRAQDTLTYRSLMESGKWLVSTGIMSTGNNFVVAGIITVLAGPAPLGLAEAARIVAQPILVLATGLSAVLAPPSMSAGLRRDRAEARRVARVFYGVTAGLGLLYLAITAVDWSLNPLARLVPAAYDVSWLVAVTIVANGLNGASFPGRFELIGANRERDLFGAEVVANVAQLVVATALAIIGSGGGTAAALARPSSFLMLGGTRLSFYRRPLDRHYAASTGPGMLDVPGDTTEG